LGSLDAIVLAVRNSSSIQIFKKGAQSRTGERLIPDLRPYWVNDRASHSGSRTIHGKDVI
jgi:hypothetical protein